MPRHKLARPNYRLRLRDRTGGFWVIDYTDPVTGRTRRVSTGQKLRSQAEIWRDQWIAGREQPIPPSQATIAEIMQAYTQARLPHVQSKVVLRFCAKTITRLIGNLEPRMLARSAYMTARGAEHMAAGSIRREVAVLRAALAWAVREKWIAEAPYVEMPPTPPPRDRWLSRADVDSLIRAAGSPHIRLFIILAYHTAARTGAILDLTWDRVDLDHRIISYDRPGRSRSRKRRAVVPINSIALAELQAARMVAVSDHVIEFRGKPVASIKTGFAQASRRAGVRCTPKVLRTTAATHMVMEHVPMVEIARMLGNTVAMVEQVYGKHSPDFLRSAADALAGETGPRENGRQRR